MNKKFSIIITSYNNNHLLTRCLKTLVGLDNNKDIEIILIDDGSKINQKKFVPKEIKNIKIIRQKNEGPSSARNRGIINSKGEYVIFIDGDDYIDLCEMKKFIFEITKNNINVDLIRHGYIRVSNKKNKVYCLKKPKYFVSLSKYIKHIFLSNKILAFSAWTHVYKRSFLIDNNLFFKKDIFGEDLEHLLRSYKKINSIYVSNTRHYIYDNKTNTTSIMNSKIKKVGEDIKSFLKPEETNNNKLKLFLCIWYYFSYKPKYKLKIKGFFKILLKSPFYIF